MVLYVPFIGFLGNFHKTLEVSHAYSYQILHAPVLILHQ